MEKQIEYNGVKYRELYDSDNINADGCEGCSFKGKPDCLKIPDKDSCIENSHIWVIDNKEAKSWKKI